MNGWQRAYFRNDDKAHHIKIMCIFLGIYLIDVNNTLFFCGIIPNWSISLSVFKYVKQSLHINRYNVSNIMTCIPYQLSCKYSAKVLKKNAVSQYSLSTSPYTWVKLIALGINLADIEPYMWVISDLQILQSICNNLIYSWCKDE